MSRANTDDQRRRHSLKLGREEYLWLWREAWFMNWDMGSVVERLIREALQRGSPPWRGGKTIQQLVDEDAAGAVK